MEYVQGLYKTMIPFVKYHGAGNDFAIFNGFELGANFTLAQEQIIKICDRRFGIGADGVLLLQAHPEYDFRMIYFNADGSRGSFCGNGGRCIVAYAYHLDLIGNKTRFIADDGIHEAAVIQKNWVELKMNDVAEVKEVLQGHYLHTGTEHYVEIVDDVAAIDVPKRGKNLRQHDIFNPNGTNVNFISINKNELNIRTYEKGVEAETLACGTGAMAAAIVLVQKENKLGSSRIAVHAKGGELEIRLHYDGKKFTDVWLCGGAEFVFEGKYL